MSNQTRIKEIDAQIAKLNKEKEELVALECIPELERKIKHYLENTYSGRELAKKHKLDEKGMWEVLGEDPNCDLGGSHVQPKLGLVEGTLHDALKYGLSHNQWYSWGGGGDIRKVTTIKMS